MADTKELDPESTNFEWHLRFDNVEPRLFKTTVLSEFHGNESVSKAWGINRHGELL